MALIDHRCVSMLISSCTLYQKTCRAFQVTLTIRIEKPATERSFKCGIAPRSPVCSCGAEWMPAGRIYLSVEVPLLQRAQAAGQQYLPWSWRALTGQQASHSIDIQVTFLDPASYNSTAPPNQRKAEAKASHLISKPRKNRHAHRM